MLGRNSALSWQTSDRDTYVISESDYSDELSDVDVSPAYIPFTYPDPTSLPHQEKVDFLTKSVPANRRFQFFLERERRGVFRTSYFNLYGLPDQPILTAKNGLSSYIYDPITGDEMAKISKWFNTFFVDSPYTKFTITVQSNFLGKNGARSFRVDYPDGRLYRSRVPVLLENKYCLDFKDIQPTPSIKNFVLYDAKQTNDDICVLAKQPNESYKLRIAAPLSMLDGMCIAITMFYSGIMNR